MSTELLCCKAILCSCLIFWWAKAFLSSLLEEVNLDFGKSADLQWGPEGSGAVAGVWWRGTGRVWFGSGACACAGLDNGMGQSRQVVSQLDCSCSKYGFHDETPLLMSSQFRKHWSNLDSVRCLHFTGLSLSSKMIAGPPRKAQYGVLILKVPKSLLGLTWSV